ncbi:MAG TPA: molybdopterin-dependent oxidoreductase, partial [Trueperaceae bacterium]|nr:molybdopterin-dependent oxidoreductase [Trueperaceae bacterium]
GAPLPPEHGYPLRVVVPGFIGARQVKWLARIEVQEAPSANYFQAVAYRRYPGTMTQASHDPAAGVELTELQVNCLVAQPAQGALVAHGPVRVRGAAYSGGTAGVAQVEVSGDGGNTWVSATLAEPPEQAQRWTWRLFECEVEVAFAAGGQGEIVARAHDTLGATQPPDAHGIWNFKGYMNNTWARVRVVRDPATS